MSSLFRGQKCVSFRGPVFSQEIDVHLSIQYFLPAKDVENIQTPRYKSVDWALLTMFNKILATPPRNKALLRVYENHWFPLIRPKIKPLITGGGNVWGGQLGFDSLDM